MDVGFTGHGKKKAKVKPEGSIGERSLSIPSTPLQFLDDLDDLLPGEDTLFFQNRDKRKHLVAMGDYKLLK